MPRKKSNLSSISKAAKRKRNSRSTDSVRADDAIPSTSTASINSSSLGPSTSTTSLDSRRAASLERDKNRKAAERINELFANKKIRLERNKNRIALLRGLESPAESEVRQKRDRASHALSRERETEAQREVRLTQDRASHTLSRERETEAQREVRLDQDRERHALRREGETEEEWEVRLEQDRERHALSREGETEEEREVRLEQDRERYHIAIDQLNINREVSDERIALFRANETDNNHSVRLATDALRHQIARELESPSDTEARRTRERERHATRRKLQWRGKVNSGFSYDRMIDYSDASSIGLMDSVCPFCSALTWKGESMGICCAAGKVFLPAILEAPEPLSSLLKNQHPKSRDFLSHLRGYNSAFQMTSFGANEVTSDGGFMPTFRIQGQVYHLIGSLLPPPNMPSSFLQIYFISDTREQVDARTNNFNTLDPVLIEQIQALLHQHNSYVQGFKSAVEILDRGSEAYKVVIKADRAPVGEHAGRFNEPTVNEVAIVMVGEPSDRRDIVLRTRSEGLTRICETHRSYDALQYPLIFFRGEDGYNFNIFHRDPISGVATTKKTSACEFYAYRLMIRQGDPNHIHQFRQLFNQFLVDMYAKIETERLLYFRTHQRQLRAENYIHLQDALRQDANVEDLGRVVILPSSFTGGPRYMHARTQDAFCYVRKYGRPDLFITITTNPNWPEIKSELKFGQTSRDRHDIVSRVFHLKLKCLMILLKKGQIFGPLRCYMYTVEWQKRGLPHAHLLLWLEEPIRPDRIDLVIRAELPDPSEDPELFEIVKSHMIHGPCGHFNRQSPCMKENRCTKKFPRQFVAETMTGEDGYPNYRRRSPAAGGFTTVIRLASEVVSVDNRWVVPYSPVLLRTFNAHINVEYCSSIKSIKYICKYVNKGSDGITIALSNENDEVQRYQSGRYISTSEAVWRILSFPIHERYPPVFQLDVHLENGQRVYFNPENVRERVETPTNTTLMAFFNLCLNDTFATTLLYSDVPSYYTFNKQRGQFSRRRLGRPVEGYPGVKRDNVIGRVYTVHPSNSECYHLRLLLHSVRGPTSFQNIRTVNGVVHPTFQSACRALGLLDDDSHWEETLREVTISDSPHKIRELFSIMLVFCNLSDPLDLWTKFRDSLSEDYLRHAQRHNNNDAINFQGPPSHCYELCLGDIQAIVFRIGGLRIEQYGLPCPPDNPLSITNVEYARETSYDLTHLRAYVHEMEPQLTEEQRQVYQNVLSSINSHAQLFFLDAPGGTGKTFLINLLLAEVRKQSKIALAVASSGIAATLLPGGRTAHSTFKIPINVDNMESPVCSISRNSSMAQVLREVTLIVWDECTMAHKSCIEALDRTLKDVRNNDSTMGGVTVLFSGDFRQTLPVVARGTRADEVNASLKRSSLWPHIQRLSLTINMRVRLGNDTGAQEFSEMLMRVGDGTMEETDGLITIPPTLGTVVNSQQQLIDKVFPGINNLPSIQSSWLCERAILTPTNEQAAQINRKVLSLFLSEERTYKSINTVLSEDEAVHYPTEFLDSVTAPGLPAHELTLKVGAPIMLLRNLCAPKLCNGTRLRITALYRYVIQADIITGCGTGESVFIPRIPLIPSNYPFQFKRLQFPVSVCFAMTVNKSQGQTLSTAGIEVSETKCFSHGQLYVACSRVRGSNCLFFHAPGGKTANVVFTEALQ